MKAFYVIMIVLTAVFMQSCNIINPKEQTPTYVHIDSFNFVRTSFQQGSGSHKITSFWVYYNNQPVGEFGFPATFPVLTNGNQGTLTFAPGITVDGITAYQLQYPFYSDDTMTLTTAPGKVTYYTPKTGYDAVSHFKYINEDFESGNGFIYIGGNDSITVTHDSSLLIEGHGSGYIHLQSPDTTSVNLYSTSFPFPTGPAFIELEYKNSMTFIVGVEVFDASNSLVTTEPDYIIGLNNSTTTNKLYLTLADFASKYGTLFPGGSFRFVVKAILPATQSSGYVVLDNIKLVTSN